MLRIAILSLLADGEYSGYDLSKAFDGSVTYIWAAGQSQIYPELHRLEDRGLISGADVPQRNRPDKRIYRITDAGRDELIGWAGRSPATVNVRDPFQLQVLNFGRLDPSVVARLVGEHRAMLQARVEALKSIRSLLERSGNTPGAPFGEAIGWRLTVEAGIVTAVAYLGWCDWALEHLAASAPEITSPGS